MPKVIYIDESGDHSLTKIDPQYPVFVLCGVVLDGEYHDGEFSASLNHLKDELFGNRDIILHTADFTRKQNGFENMADPTFRARFFSELENWIRSARFKLISCVIKKDKHLSRYGSKAIDPYLFSLSVLVERFIFETGREGGSIVAEGRGAVFDNALDLAFLDLKIRGTEFVQATKLRNRIHQFRITPKRENIPGLQLADVLATPIGRNVLGKKTYANYTSGGDFFTTIEPKFRTDWEGKKERFGLVVLPK